MSIKKDGLVMYTIYDHPADFPNNYIVRSWMVKAAKVESGEVIAMCDTLAEARACLPQGSTRLPRDVNDDPVIVESWL